MTNGFGHNQPAESAADQAAEAGKQLGHIWDEKPDRDTKEGAENSPTSGEADQFVEGTKARSLGPGKPRVTQLDDGARYETRREASRDDDRDRLGWKERAMEYTVLSDE